jgi:hypothetical protein
VSKTPKPWDDISSSGAAVAFDVSKCTTQEEAIEGSPIDDYYKYQASILPLGTPEALSTHDALGRLLLLALVSGVEAYFRNVLSRVLNCCHMCRAYSSQQMLPLAAVDYYSDDRVTLGLFENTSFASEGEILKQTRKYTKIDVTANSAEAIAIENFEVVSHLRHASVHSRGALSSKNALMLQLPRGLPEGVVVIRLKQLHEIANVCMTTVRSYNRFLYRELLRRWVKEGVLTWQWQRDSARFVPLFSTFASRLDKTSIRNTYHAYLALRAYAMQNPSQRSRAIAGNLASDPTVVGQKHRERA